MRLNGYYFKKERATGEIWSDLSGTYKVETSVYAKRLYELGMKRHKTPRVQEAIKRNLENYFEEALRNGDIAINKKQETYKQKEQNEISSETQQLAKDTAQKLINFFSEFEFEPNFRFVNTLSKNSEYLEDAIEYVTNYFALTNNPHKYNVAEKLKSTEFKLIVANLQALKTTTTINKRFELFYGSQGTGKTTQAIKLSDSVMVCHSAMLPQDLMEDFQFIDGKAHFTPSALQIAMVEGKTITLDEINLLPFESLRFLQSILDNKTEFEYKGKRVKIAEGFKIIGTMNLIVNGVVYALPEPLIDRAASLKEFKLTADSLMNALV